MGSCCYQRDIIASEELIRNKITNLSLSNISLIEITKELEKNVIYGKIHKSILMKNIFKDDSIISEFEQNLINLIFLKLPENMTISKSIFYFFSIFSKKKYIKDSNSYIYLLFKGMCKNEILTIKNLETQLYDYIYYNTYIINEFIENNLESNEQSFKEDIKNERENFLNQNNVNTIVNLILGRFKEKNINLLDDNFHIDIDLFSQYLDLSNICSFVNLRDSVYSSLLITNYNKAKCK